MRLSTLFASALLLGLPCFATTIISGDPAGDLVANPLTGGSQFSINGSPLISGAAGFTMGGTSFDLTSVAVELSAESTFSTSVLVADLFGGTTSSPSGSSLVSFVAASGTISAFVSDQVFTLTPVSAFVLDAATTYWLVLSATADVGGHLEWESAASIGTEPFASYVGSLQSVGFSPPTDAIPGAHVLDFQVNGSEVGADGDGGNEVPEPRAVSAMVIGLFLLVGWLRRDRNRATA